MFLKSHNFFNIFLILFYCIFSSDVFSKDEDKFLVIRHIESLTNFSASFIQMNGDDLSEGRFYIGDERIRAEYITPSKILIILDEDKAMYYNYDLEENEFFNPKKTDAWFLYDIFSNPNFLDNAKLKKGNNQLILEKTGFDKNEEEFLIRLFLENSPVILRKVQILINNNEVLELSMFNHKYEEVFHKDFFKLSMYIQVTRNPFFKTN